MCIYTSPEIQNEIIKVMGLQVLRDDSADLQGSSFLTVMADKTTDSSNWEQVSQIFYQVTQELEVHEEFLGLYHISSIDPDMLTRPIVALLTKFSKNFVSNATMGQVP